MSICCRPYLCPKQHIKESEIQEKIYKRRNHSSAVHKNLQDVNIYSNSLNELLPTERMPATHVALSNLWISSSVLPLVSGTTFATNSTVTKLAAENRKNVPAYRRR